MRTGIIDGFVDDMWAVVHDSGELSSAVTSYDITGLEGDTDIEYHLIVRAVSGTASTWNGKVQLNNDTSTNYGVQVFTGDGTTASAGNSTTETGFQALRCTGLGELTMGDIHIFAKSGKERTAIWTGAREITGTTVDNIRKGASSWSNTADEVTSMKIVADSASGLGIGTRIILLKKVHNTDMQTGDLTPNQITGAWERIYSNTLSSAATTTTISGLSGNTDVIYRLILRPVSGTATSWTGTILLNNDTGNNYGNHRLRGWGTTADAARSVGINSINAMRLTGSGELNICDSLIYAKSGYERTTLTTSATEISGTSIFRISEYGYVWNNTASEITSIVLTSGTPITNAWGVGSSIELYRLNL